MNGFNCSVILEVLTNRQIEPEMENKEEFFLSTYIYIHFYLYTYINNNHIIILQSNNDITVAWLRCFWRNGKGGSIWEKIKFRSCLKICGFPQEGERLLWRKTHPVDFRAELGCSNIRIYLKKEMRTFSSLEKVRTQVYIPILIAIIVVRTDSFYDLLCSHYILCWKKCSRYLKYFSKQMYLLMAVECMAYLSMNN